MKHCGYFLLGLIAVVSMTFGQAGAQSPLVVERVFGHRAASGSVDITMNLAARNSNITITEVNTRTLAGSGQVAVPSAARPMRVTGGGATSIQFSVPPGVKRFSVTINGTEQDSSGALKKFSFSRAIIPSAISGVDQK